MENRESSALVTTSRDWGQKWLYFLIYWLGGEVDWFELLFNHNHITNIIFSQ